MRSLSDKVLDNKWYIFGILTTIVTLAFLNALIRSGFLFSIDYNEGWNAMYIQKVLNNESLYSSGSPYINNNYPPLSFHIIAFFSKITGNVIMTGRYISIIAVLSISFIITFIVRKKGGGYYSSFFSGVFCLGLFSILANHYVGMNDPQLLGNLISTLALAMYIINYQKYLFSITLLIVIGVFIKHSLVILPIVFFIDLILNHSRKVFKYVLFLFINAFILIGLLVLTSNQEFLSQILMLETSRVFSISLAIKNSLRQLTWIQVPIVIALIYLFMFYRERANRTILIYIIISIIIGIFFSGGEGVDVNVFFDLFISLSVAIGYVLMYSKSIMKRSDRVQAISWLLPLLLSFGLLFRSLPKLIRPELIRNYRNKESDFKNDTEMLKKQSGVLLSENILLSYSSGKEFIFDAFYVSQLLKSGKLAENDLIKKIELGKHQIIQLNAGINTCYKLDSIYGRLKFNNGDHRRFSDNILKAIEKNYLLFHTSKNGSYYRYKKN